MSKVIRFNKMVTTQRFEQRLCKTEFYLDDAVVYSQISEFVVNTTEEVKAWSVVYHVFPHVMEMTLP